MTTPINSILRKVTRKPGDALNIFIYPHDGYYERNLCLTGHNFFTTEYPFKDRPSNLHILSDSPKHIPTYLNIDLVILNHRITQYDRGITFGNFMHVPNIIVDHWHPRSLKQVEFVSIKNKTRSDLVVSTDAEIQKAWGIESELIPYGVENIKSDKNNSILIYGKFTPYDYYLLQSLTKDSNVILRGDNPGLSKDCTEDELTQLISNAKIYINLSTEDTISYNLLRAMSAGCCIISNKTSILTNILNESNSIVCTKLTDFQEAIKSPKVGTLAIAAKHYAEENLSMGGFIRKWQNLLERADKVVFRK